MSNPQLNKDEQRLVSRARQGDAASFEILVRRYGQYAYNLALRVVADPLEAEDLTQEAFLRAWQALPRFRSQSSFSTWLYRIVTNLCFNRLPQMKKELAGIDGEDILIDLPDKSQEVEPVLLSTELRLCLHQAIRELSPGQRLLITLRHLQGLSYNEIAHVTAMPLGSVKTGIHRARQSLRQALVAYEGGARGPK
jgi:RNA polymerase sigma-70 factor (ECF subfamily)